METYGFRFYKQNYILIYFDFFDKINLSIKERKF